MAHRNRITLRKVSRFRDQISSCKKLSHSDGTIPTSQNRTSSGPPSKTVADHWCLIRDSPDHLVPELMTGTVLKADVARSRKTRPDDTNKPSERSKSRRKVSKVEIMCMADGTIPKIYLASVKEGKWAKSAPPGIENHRRRENEPGLSLIHI